MAKVEVKELLDNGVHFGHLTRKWDPNMAPYIYMERNGIHIINLYKTVAKLEEASKALSKIAASGRKILFVATKKQAKDIVAENAAKAKGVQIFIGSKNFLFKHSGLSMVMAPYKNKEQEIVGAIGVVGPTRLNYSKIVPLVDYTSKIIGKVLK